MLAATNTNAPVFNGEWLREGTHVTSIVGSNVGMVQAGVIAEKRRELDDDTLARASHHRNRSRVLAEQDEQGDVFEQVRAGLISWNKVAELREIVGGQRSGRENVKDITVFKNNGGRELRSWLLPI